MNINQNILKKFSRPAIAVIISLYGLYLRLLILKDHEFWADEYAYFSQMTGSFWDLIKDLPNLEFCSYLSGDIYLVYPFFKLAPYNKWVLAIPHLIITVIGFYLLYLLCKRYLKTLIGFAVVFTVVSVNKTLMYHAIEIRPYAVLTTLALACLYFALELVEQGASMARKRKVFIGIYFVMVLWFHLYGLFTLFFPLIYALSTKVGDKSFKTIVLHTAKFMSVVLCIAMPLWLYSVFGPHLPRGGDHYGFSTYMFIPSPFTDTVGFMKAVFGNLVGRKSLYFLLIFMITPFVVPYKEKFRQIAYLVILVLAPISLLFMMDVKYNYFFVQRQFIWVMPLFALFLGWSCESFIFYIKERPIFKNIFKGRKQ